MSVVRVAAVQMVSGADVGENLKQAGALVAQAHKQGAELVLLPEYFGVMGVRATDKVRLKERDGDGPQQAFLADTARALGIVLVGGTVPLACDDASRVRSACLVYGPDGKRLARYDKIHLFRFAQGDEAYDETRTIERGDAVVAFDAPFGRVGLSICYDMRFPELYRALGDCALVLVPGRVHLDDRQRALAPAAAGPRGREPGLGARGGAGRRARRAPHLRPLLPRRSLGRDRRRAQRRRTRRGRRRGRHRTDGRRAREAARAHASRPLTCASARPSARPSPSR